MKNNRIQSFSGPHFLVFKQNTDQKNSKYGRFLCSERYPVMRVSVGIFWDLTGQHLGQLLLLKDSWHYVIVITLQLLSEPLTVKALRAKISLTVFGKKIIIDVWQGTNTPLRLVKNEQIIMKTACIHGLRSIWSYCFTNFAIIKPLFFLYP